MEKNKKKQLTERLIILAVALVVLALLVFFLKDIFFPFIKLEINNDVDGAKELLLSKGFLGYMTVSLVEALQMVVIFIPAEFIQLSSGMSYPWYMAILLCDIGVCLGASIIYFLVNIFNFDVRSIRKDSKIEKYQRIADSNQRAAEKKLSATNRHVIFMYILFIMPIIPFGAICYWASSKKIPYHRYILTCATGVIPSISTSIVMGAAIREFITRALPLWLLILIIVAAAAFLFVLLAFVLNRFFFKQNKGTPNSVYYGLFMGTSKKILNLLCGKTTVLPNGVSEIEGPYLMLTNHHSPFDFNYADKIDPTRNMALVVNRYEVYNTKLKKFFINSGAIPKKIFEPDMQTIRGIYKAKKDGYPIFMCPEGRLSTDGTTSHISLSTAALCKKIDIPIVLAQIRHAYFAKPKWRKKLMRTPVEVEVMRILTPEETEAMTKEELRDVIEENLSFSEFDCPPKSVRGGKKAEGLENVLYMCPHCGNYYTNETRGNVMTCSHCGKTYEIGKDYGFINTAEGDFKNLSEYYQRIKEIERKGLDDVNFDIEVTTKIFNRNEKKPREDEGLIHFDNEKITYRSSKSDLYIERTVESLEGLAYSCGEEFEFYYNDELYYFYPKENRRICTRVALIYEELKEEQWKAK